MAAAAEARRPMGENLLRCRASKSGAAAVFLQMRLSVHILEVEWQKKKNTKFFFAVLHFAHIFLLLISTDAEQICPEGNIHPSSHTANVTQSVQPLGNFE